MTKSDILKHCLKTSVCGVVLLTSAAAGATVISGTSDGYGAEANLTAINLINLQLGPAPESSGTAPLPYNESNALATASIGPIPLGPVIGQAFASTGVLTTAAQSNVDGNPGNRFASANASVNNTMASIWGLNFSSTTIASNAQVSGDYGALNATGGATLETASLDVDIGDGQSFDLPLEPGPNTDVLPGVLNPFGISLLLNEQDVTGNGIDSRGITVNALHLSFDDTPLGNLLNLGGLGQSLGLGDLDLLGSVLNGDIIIAHSFAQLNAVRNDVAAPSGTGILVLLGLGLFAMAWTKRKKFPDAR